MFESSLCALPFAFFFFSFFFFAFFPVLWILGTHRGVFGGVGDELIFLFFFQGVGGKYSSTWWDI